MNNYFKKNEKLKIEYLENGIILPQKETAADYPLWGLGGVCDENNNFFDMSFYDGGWATHGGYYDWEVEEYLDDEVIYVGMFYLHWGHFLIDLTNRMWCLSELIKKNPEIKVAYIGEEEPKGNNLRFFELLGVQKNQLIHISKPTRCKTVIVPEQGFKSCEWYTDEFLHMFDDMCKSVLALNYDFKKVSSVKEVYFTRRSFSKAVSSEFGEAFFENTFNKNGYTSVSPETLTLEEQIYLWNNAEKIVCINGTIPLNVIFCCNKNLQLTVLNKTSILHENPYILLQMREVTARFVDIYEEPLKKYPKSLGEGPYLLKNTADFINYSQQEKFISAYSETEIKKYFKKCKSEYIVSIIALGKRIKEMIRKLIPNFILEKRKNNITN